MVWRKAWDPMASMKYGCKITSHWRFWKWPSTWSVTNQIRISCTSKKHKLFSKPCVFILSLIQERDLNQSSISRFKHYHHTAPQRLKQFGHAAMIIF